MKNNEQSAYHHSSHSRTSNPQAKNFSLPALLACCLIAALLLSACTNKDTAMVNRNSGNPAYSTATTTNTSVTSAPRAGMSHGIALDEQAEAKSADKYSHTEENGFREVTRQPLSTFSIDVDTASYSNTRRFINENQLPPADAVRVEEFINYFSYDYPQPVGNTPFSVTTEVVVCPWNTRHHLVQIGLQGRRVQAENLPPANLVFLVDVSGSMQDADKLPLLKRALRSLVEQLTARDHVSLVVYAGSSGLVLPSTSGDRKREILRAVERLEAGGSTNGGAGIELAYRIARENFIKDGTNRVILATDGDFNVGTTGDTELVRLIEEKRRSGVFLTVLGLGTGNLNHSMMEKLADHGNGNYAYLDSFEEARKVLVHELSGTLATIAKDVKIQVEFNPRQAAAYRLIGYENRLLRDEDFNDDRKDAGEIGAGHTVTALYEVVPYGERVDASTVSPLKYQQPSIRRTDFTRRTENSELLTLQLRYKEPAGDKSQLLSVGVADSPVSLARASENLRFASAVALFGMLLKDSKHTGTATYDTALELARGAQGADPQGYRREFINLIEAARRLEKQNRS